MQMKMSEFDIPQDIASYYFITNQKKYINSKQCVYTTLQHEDEVHCEPLQTQRSYKCQTLKTGLRIIHFSFACVLAF